MEELLGDDAELLLNHRSETLDKANLHLPGPDFVDRVFLDSDRSTNMLRQLQWLIHSGRLSGTGYVSILPIDQGIEHSGGASFAPNPLYFDPDNLVKLAVEGGCNAIASTLGVLGAVSRKWAHSFPFIVKLNHNELLTYPNEYDQVMFGSVDRAWNMGAAGVGATIYFGSEQSRRQIVEVAEAFEQAHRARHVHRALVLPAQLRPSRRRTWTTTWRPTSPGQANHLGVTIQADIIKQKLPENNGGYNALGPGYGKTNPKVYEELTHRQPDRPDPLPGDQLLPRPGGPDQQRWRLVRESDLAEAVRTAVINKRAGGMGLISGRKAFQRPMDEGVALLHAIQDVYLADEITVA